MVEPRGAGHERRVVLSDGKPWSGNHRRCFAPRLFPDAGQFIGDRDQIGQGCLRVLFMLGRLRFIGLDINAQGGARRARAGEAEHDARAVVEDDADALAGADAVVDRVGIAEIVAVGDAALSSCLPFSPAMIS